jgi:hypothetical protein
VLGVGLALALQGMFWISHSNLAVPYWIAAYGCAMSLLLSSAVRMSLPPATDQFQGANAPAAWLKQTAPPLANSPGMIRAVKSATAILVVAMVGSWIATRWELPKPRMITLLLVLVVGYQVWKRN